MAKKHMKCSKSLALKEMPIKTMLRFNLTPVIMATIKRRNNKCWQGYGGKNISYTAGGNKYKLVQPLQKTVWQILQKLKIELPYYPTIPLLGYTQMNVNQVTIKAPARPCLLLRYSPYLSYGNSKVAH
jgi:hypothetical protein